MNQNITEQLDKWKETAIQWSAGLIPYAILAAIAFAFVYVILKVLKKPKKAAEQAPDMGINVKDLPAQGPPPAGPALSFYKVPVRLAALVLAPAGRGRDLPPVNQLQGVIDAIVPGLARVVTAHQPVVRKWPAQISSSGFAHVLFTHAKLPGEGGKGTPWCAVAGTFKIGKTPILAGLVMHTAAPTNLGQVILEHEAQWLDVLRVK
jgi:hypothetical protein